MNGKKEFFSVKRNWEQQSSACDNSYSINVTVDMDIILNLWWQLDGYD